MYGDCVESLYPKQSIASIIREDWSLCLSFCLIQLINVSLYTACHQLGLDLPPLCGADRNLVLSPGQRANQHRQELAQGRASGQWK